jgi:hypothetical protein
MPAKKRHRFVYFRPELLQLISSIPDPEDRAKACCHYNLIASHEEVRLVLAGCADGSGFHQGLVRERLKLTAYPQRKLTPRTKKPMYRSYTSTGLPSLLPPTRPDFEIWQGAPESPSEPDVIEELAAKTLSQSLADMPPDNLEEGLAFLDLVEGLSEEDRASIVARWRSMEPVRYFELANLWRAFGIEMESRNQPADQADQDELVADKTAPSDREGR